MDDIDRRLVTLLQCDARLPVTSLGHSLGISRSNVYARLERLERSGVIEGYTVRLGPAYSGNLIRAHVALKVTARLAPKVEQLLLHVPQLTSLHAISGDFDMIAVIEAANVTELNALIDRIGCLDGVEGTVSSVLLDTKSPKAF